MRGDAEAALLRTRHLGPLVVGHVLLDAVLIGGFTVPAAAT